MNRPSTSQVIKIDSDSENEIEDDDEVVPEIQELPEQLNVYNRYDFKLLIKDLPIKKKREEILEAIRDFSIIVIKAETGTGI